MIKLELDEELLFTGKQRRWLLEKEFTPGEDVVKIVDMTKKDENKLS